MTKVLIVEDNPGDARLIREMFAEVPGTPYDLQLAESLSAGLETLESDHIDVVLLDLSLPDSQGFETFSRVCTAAPDVPIVMLTGLDDESLAAEMLRMGGQDYLVKGSVDGGQLLSRAIRYAIQRKALESELRALEKTLAVKVHELEQALDQVKLLQGILPICGYCKKVRDDKNYWQQVEQYITTHSEARFSHSICPDCYEDIIRPQLDEMKERRQRSGPVEFHPASGEQL